MVYIAGHGGNIEYWENNSREATEVVGALWRLRTDNTIVSYPDRDARK